MNALDLAIEDRVRIDDDFRVPLNPVDEPRLGRALGLFDLKLGVRDRLTLGVLDLLPGGLCLLLRQPLRRGFLRLSLRRLGFTGRLLPVSRLGRSNLVGRAPGSMRKIDP